MSADSIAHVNSLNPRHDSSHAVSVPIAAAERHQPGYAAWKRTTDFLAALILFLFTLPITLAAMLAVKLTSRGPALYSQTRLGREGRPFTLYKIRSMSHNCEQRSGIRWCVPGDSRVTPVGRFLRKSKIDELPQLWNVLRGDMSLIGPRPERPEFLPDLEASLSGYRDRLLVRPGLSGLAQVQLPPDTDLNSVRRKLAYDLYYVRQASLVLDLRLMLGTLGYLLRLPVAFTTRALGIPGPLLVEASGPPLATREKQASHLAVLSERSPIQPAPLELCPVGAVLAKACNP